MTTIDVRLAQLRGAAERVADIWDRLAQWLKSLMPKGLYARSLLIIVTPMVILQSVVAFVFMERHWNTVTRRLSAAVTQDIATLIDVYETYKQDPDGSTIRRIALDRLGLVVDFLPGTDLPPPGPKPFFSLLDQALSVEVRKQIARPFWIDTVGRSSLVEIRIKLDDTILRVFASRSAAYASNSQIFLLWMVGTSLVLLAVGYLFPVVQVPPRGIWGARGPARWTAAESWLGRGLDQRPDLERLFVRYLGAFGPATIKDAQTWSGLTRLAEVAGRLGPALRRFHGDAGQELLDLPDAPRPGPEVPAPPRFLPEYDNVLLSHANRGRIVTGGRPIPLPPGPGGTRGTLLVDGMFQGTWQITRSGQRATLRIETFARLSGPDAAAVTGEGTRLLAFAAAGADPDVVLSATGT